MGIDDDCKVMYNSGRCPTGQDTTKERHTLLQNSLFCSKPTSTQNDLNCPLDADLGAKIKIFVIFFFKHKSNFGINVYQGDQ